MGSSASIYLHLNDGLNQLSAQDKLTGGLQIKIPKQPKPTIPKPGMDDEFSKDQLWNPCAEMQRMQSEMEQIFGEFQRVLTLPGSANASKMKTDYHNGVLTITIPKE